MSIVMAFGSINMKDKLKQQRKYKIHLLAIMIVKTISCCIMYFVNILQVIVIVQNISKLCFVLIQYIILMKFLMNYQLRYSLKDGKDYDQLIFLFVKSHLLLNATLLSILLLKINGCHHKIGQIKILTINLIIQQVY